MGGATVGEVVSIDAGDDNIAEAHRGGHAGDVGGLIGVESELGFFGGTFGNGTEAAAASAEVAEDHKGGLAAMEALMEIRAAGRFTNGVKVEPAEVPLEGGDGLEMSGGLAEPFRQAAANGGATGRGGVLDLNQQTSKSNRRCGGK